MKRFKEEFATALGRGNKTERGYKESVHTQDGRQQFVAFSGTRPQGAAHECSAISRSG